MRSGKFRIFTLSIFLVLLINILVFAGTTGKIAGRVTDKETGEPLFGVNIIVQGTTLGDASDMDGYFAVLNVPPGLHSIKASMIGYAPVTVSEIRVRIDETSPINIELVAQAIETGSVVVIAERNIIKKDVSTSVSAVQPEEIESLPVTSINDVVGLQAGIEDGLVIRGGSADQALFQLDGVTLRDPRNNKPISSIALSSIQEVSIERGGFNAEYGQVRSGIINIVTKEGDVFDYTGSIQVKYSPPTPKNFGISVYDPNSMWNRPYLDPAVCWTGTQNGAWDLYTQRQYPQFIGWNAVSQSLLTDDDPTNDLSPAAAQKLWEFERRRRPPIEPDYNIDASFGGPVPFVSQMLGNLRFFSSFYLDREMLLIPLSRPDYKEYNGSIKINSNISKAMNLMLTANIGRSYNVALNAADNQFNNPAWGINGVQFWNPTDYMRTPFQIAEITNEQRAARIFTDSWYSQAQVDHLTLGGKFTDFITSSTFYEVSFEHVNTRYLTGPVALRDTSKIYEIVPGYFVDEAPFGFDINPTTGIGEPGFFFGGHSSTIRDSSKLYSYALKGDLTSQLTKEHLIKTGVELVYYDLNLNYGLDEPFFNTSNFVKKQWNPYRISAYAQDKIEMLGFIANIGVRMDLSNPNTEWANVDAFNKAYFSSSYNGIDTAFSKQKAEVDVAFSPRLGISHPITENSKLYFNYGHFKEMPAYEEIFRIGRSTNGQLLNFGNPNLVQAKTISYELGYDHVLFDEYLLQVAAFYNDITNQLSYTQYQSDRLGIGYYEATNNSYADIRGLEITLRKTGGSWIRGFANYTYQVTTQGAFGKQTINEDPTQQKLIDQNTPLLYQQKPIPQPRANASLTFFTPGDYGPDFAGMKPLGDWSLNLLGQWRSGEYITYNPNGAQNILNNVEVTDVYNVDLRLNKTLDFKNFAIMLIVEVTNLLNTKRLSGASFYDSYDQSYYLQSLHLPQSPAYSNIPGTDKIGDYRKEGVPYQPVEQAGNLSDITNPNPSVIYYNTITKKYMNYVNGNWSEVESSRMQKVLDDKAYIDMPNNSSFDFLNPRQVFFGFNITFKL
jgi:outer membrane receptor protein involved in Fe transport